MLLSKNVSKYTKISTPIISNNNGKRTFIDPVTILATSGVLAGSGIAFVNLRYRISDPDEYLIRTGLFISDMKVSKQGIQWPFQTYKFIKMQPINFSFDLNSMSLEKLEFVLPCVFTIGPKNDPESIEKYARLLPVENGVVNQSQSDLHKLIQGIIEGESRALSASMTIEEIFSDRKKYKEALLKGIQDELSRFGLEVYNVNIKELQDTPGSEYFERVRQKKRSEAENNAKINIAEAQKTGDIGQKEKQATTRQQVAQLESETVLKENERQQEIEKSKAELAVVKAQALQKTEIARIEAENAAKSREADLQKEVEQRRIAMETEKLRAKEMSKAQVLAETNVKDAEGEANALRLKAEAELYAEQRKAEGILAVYNAQSTGIQNLIGSFGNDISGLIQYLMIDKGLYVNLARANADAIKGLNPKIVQWNTTSSPAGQKGTDAIADVLKMLPPLVTTIHDQTGIKPADWLLNMTKINKE